MGILWSNLEKFFLVLIHFFYSQSMTRTHLLQKEIVNYYLKGSKIHTSAAHFSRFEFFAKSEKNEPIFREKCEKLRKRFSSELYQLISTEMTPILGDY